MRRAAVPRALHERLGDDATDALVQVFNRQQEQMTDDIARAVVRALEPRFASIEARLDNCATKEDIAGFATKEDVARCATKEDLAGFATKGDLDRFATKADLAAFPTKDDFNSLRLDTNNILNGFRVEMVAGLAGLRSDMADHRSELLKWMFIFWAGQAFVVLAYFRAGQYLAGR